MVMLSAVLCLMSYWRTKKISWKCLSLLVGNLLGLMIMFSSTIYTTLFATGSTLNSGRSLAYDQGGSLISILQSCAEGFVKETASLIWEQNVVICCSISVLLIILWTVKCKRDLTKTERLLIGIDILSIPYFIVFTYLEYGKYFLLRYGLLDLCEILANIGYFLVVALQIILLYPDRKWHMRKLLILWCSAPMVILPLTAVVIEGSRFYITSNCFLIVFALFLLNDCVSDMSRKTAELLLSLGLSVLLSFSMFYAFLYREIGSCTELRMQIMEEARQTGEKEIILPAYPYTVMDYVWWGEPGEAYREVYFREFFGLDPDVSMTFQLN